MECVAAGGASQWSRLAVERLAVERLAVERLAVERLAVERLAVERLAAGAAPPATRAPPRARRPRACSLSPQARVADENVPSTPGNTGDVYIRVQGKNGSFDPAQSFKSATRTWGSALASPISRARQFQPGTFNTVILTDRSRMTFDSALDGKVTGLATKVNGVVVNVDADRAVHALNAQAVVTWAARTPRTSSSPPSSASSTATGRRAQAPSSTWSSSAATT